MIDLSPFYRAVLRFYRGCGYTIGLLLILGGLYLFMDDLLMILHRIPPELPEIREGPLGLLAGPLIAGAGGGLIFRLLYTRETKVHDD
jgi:hypothetical protein